jgi:hypothetical protein
MMVPFSHERGDRQHSQWYRIFICSANDDGLALTCRQGPCHNRAYAEPVEYVRTGARASSSQI